jgi:hypothetical protein
MCTEHQISQSQYDQWRDQLLVNAAKIFEIPQQLRREAHLEHENTKLKKLAGELTIELQKKRGVARITRQRSLLVLRRDAGLHSRIQVLKAAHPFWGHRRIWAYQHFIERLPVNKKRILPLMRKHHLLVAPNLRLKAQRTPTRSEPRPSKPNEWGAST